MQRIRLVCSPPSSPSLLPRWHASELPYYVWLQAAWALGNIAGDCEAFRDQVLACGALLPLIRYDVRTFSSANDSCPWDVSSIISKESRDDIIRNANWAMSNLCRGKSPRVDFESIAPALTVMHRLLYSEDEQLLIGRLLRSPCCIG
jgi:hypothetical protein